jgi:hypothetical protein
MYLLYILSFEHAYIKIIYMPRHSDSSEHRTAPQKQKQNKKSRTRARDESDKKINEKNRKKVVKKEKKSSVDSLP